MVHRDHGARVTRRRRSGGTSGRGSPNGRWLGDGLTSRAGPDPGPAHHPVVHFEFNGPDGDALAAFYAELFGWDIRQAPDSDYRSLETRGGAGINGGIATTEDGRAYSTFYVASDAPDRLLDRAVAAGGTIVLPLTATPMATFGRFADPDGLIVGVVKASERPGPSEGDGAPVDWFEVLGTDGERTQRFYRDVFDWRIEDGGSAGYELVAHEHNGEGRDLQIGGGLGGGVEITWATVYARVPDVETSLQRAATLGGERVYGPNRLEEGMETGAFRDPAGNPFGLYRATGG